MRELPLRDCYTVAGGELTDKQVDSLMGKMGAYSFNALLYASLAGISVISWQTMFIGAVLAPIAKIGGTYVAYDNKDWLLEQAKSTSEYIQSYF